MVFLPPKCPKEYQIPNDSNWQQCKDCSNWRVTSAGPIKQKINVLCQTLNIPCQKPMGANTRDIDYVLGKNFRHPQELQQQTWKQCDDCKKMRWVPDYLQQISSSIHFHCPDIYYSCEEPQFLSNDTIDFLVGKGPSAHYVTSETETRVKKAEKEGLDICNEAVARSIALGLRTHASNNKRNISDLDSTNKETKRKKKSSPFKDKKINRKILLNHSTATNGSRTALERTPSSINLSSTITPKHKGNIISPFRYDKDSGKTNKVSASDDEEFRAAWPTVSALKEIIVQKPPLHHKKKWMLKEALRFESIVSFDSFFLKNSCKK